MEKQFDSYFFQLITFFQVIFADRLIILRNEIVFYLKPEHLLTCLTFLKSSSFFRFTVLTDVICTDYPYRSERFELSYILVSFVYNFRLKVKCFLDQPYGLNSINTIFRSANWLEREIWDLYGILFFEHPDLRRILTDYGFDGYPLRRDFPLGGFFEIRYHEGLKRIVFEPVEFTQRFRYFEFKNPWA